MPLGMKAINKNKEYHGCWEIRPNELDVTLGD